jgi:hypothetical protein
LIRLLSGAFGEVLKAKNLKNGKFFALKKIRMKDLSAGITS